MRRLKDEDTLAEPWNGLRRSVAKNARTMLLSGWMRGGLPCIQALVPQDAATAELSCWQ